MKFTNAELAAILAGLRLLQLAVEYRPGTLADVSDVFDCGGGCVPLTVEEIDALCHNINR